VDKAQLAATVDACRSLIRDRFGDDDHHGAAAMLLDDGTIVTGTAPDAINPSVEVCHEIEPYCAAFRLSRSILASVCLHRAPGGRTLVLSPCGVCRERLAVHGPNVLVAVADVDDPTLVVWKPLKDVLPDYWMTVFPDEIDASWTD
jgi:cytidine deaminase